MSNVHNAGRMFVRGLTLSAIAVAFVVAAQSNAQVVCQKTSNSGKAKFKIRDLCKVEKGETQIANFGDLVQRNETDDLVEQLASDIADQIAAIPRTRVLGVSGLAATFGTSLTQVGSPFEFETFGSSSNLSITFDSDCALVTEFAGESAHIDILFDGVAVSPTAGVVDTFCASVLDNILAPMPGSRTVVVSDVPAGIHVITIQVAAGSGAGLLTEGSLTVIASENEEEAG